LNRAVVHGLLNQVFIAIEIDDLGCTHSLLKAKTPGADIGAAAIAYTVVFDNEKWSDHLGSFLDILFMPLPTLPSFTF
jgi:hypothetical protein